MILETTLEEYQKYQKNLTKAQEDCGLEMEDFVYPRQEVKYFQNIAFIHINGTLIKNASKIEKELGNTDYSDILEDIEDALEDNVVGIVFIMDSGGGHSVGSEVVVDKILSLTIPTVTYVDSCCCSAAYKIATATSSIIASKGAEVGSIGSLLYLLDTSAASAMKGIKPLVYTNEGAIYKSIGHDTSITPEQEAYIQDKINKSGERFQSIVRANRNIDERCFSALTASNEEAIELGLIDGIGEMEDCVEIINFLNQDSPAL